MTSPTYQRKQYFIDPAFQSDFMVKFSLIVIAASLVIGCVVYIFSGSSTTMTIEHGRVLVKSTADFILPILVVTGLVVSLCAGACVAFMGMYVSHKIAGPMFRLKREIELFQSGDLRRNFSIRDTDQLQHLAGALKDMAQQVHDKHMYLKDKLKTLEGAVSANQAHEKVVFHLEEVKKAMEYFKV